MNAHQIFLFLACNEIQGLRLHKMTCDLHTQFTQKPLSFTSFDHGSSYQGLYVNKTAKFAFCTIEKNACSKWTAILNKLRTGDLNLNQPSYGISHQTFSAEEALAVFSDDSATRAVFVRDPLERFLSGFLNKCTKKNCENQFCAMRSKSMAGQKIPFEAAVKWLQKKDVANLDGHFKLQSKHCELDKRILEYNVVHVMKSSSLSKDASCLLEKTNLGRLNTQGPKNGNKVFWEENNQDDARTTELLKHFYTREAAEVVFKIFERDYQTFSIPRPKWIDSANGQFYQSVDTFSCEKALLKTDIFESMDDDEDELVVLAKRAGFIE